MATKLTPVDQALIGLQDIQSRILRLSLSGEPVSGDDAAAISDEVGANVAIIRRTLSRTAQALRGELNGER